MYKLLIPLLLTSCTAPQEYIDVANQVNREMTYQEDVADEWKLNCPEYGDCDDFALCAMDKLGKGRVSVFETWDGYHHAVLNVGDGWYIDPVNKRVDRGKYIQKGLKYTCGVYADTIMCIDIDGKFFIKE